ncbi:unnamed protein product [Adineta steineri]|uniref:Uncharacterized protein n=1 Tax=Adineta steineri TaxID=433720 RepID=A0A813ZAC0_9BILA|nr:unnamed protein product [Adineta steineri]CAF1239275.1 unnamed protein product [Adineta steineri]
MSNTNRFKNSNKTEEEEDDDDENDNDENHWYYPRTSSPHSSLSVNNSFTHPSSSVTMGSWGFDVNRSTNGQTPLSFTSNNNNNNSNSDKQIMTKITKDYNERLGDKFASSSSSSQNLKLRTPALTKQRNGNEFAAVDRLLHGPNRTSKDVIEQQMTTTTTQQPKIHAEQELIAWQNRMLQRDQRFDSSSSKLNNKRNEVNINSVRSSSRQTSTATNRRIPTILNTNENQYLEHDHHEPTIKSARVIKRYIELVYHLQSFYERISDQLSNGNGFLKTNQSSPSLFINHCRKMTEQLQKLKPIWEEKLVDLQNQLKNISSLQGSTMTNETTFLQRRLTLINLLQLLSKEKELDDTDLSIRIDIDRVLHEDKLAVQLQDELSTLLQHQLYSSNEQDRVEHVLLLLREQITTTDSYMSHVSQQLNELVTSLRSSEKYILSYTNTVPLIDDGTSSQPNTSSNRDHWRPYDKTDIDFMKTRESRLQQSRRNENINEKSSKLRSTSMPRLSNSEESDHNLDRDTIRKSLIKAYTTDLNRNNSNNSGVLTRFATVKSAKRNDKTPSNVKSILKSYPHIHSSNGRKKDYDIDIEVDIPDRFIDFDSNDQILTTNERIERIKKKDDVRRVLSKQSIHEANNQTFSDDDIKVGSNRQKYSKKRERALNLRSMFTEEAKEKNHQITGLFHFLFIHMKLTDAFVGKHYMNKSYQQRMAYPNA